MTVSPATLRNKGVPVDVAVVDRLEAEDGSVTYSPKRSAKGEPVTEKVWIRFDMNVLADIEEEWGSAEAFQRAIAVQQNATIRKLFGMILGVEAREAGRKLIPEKAGDYATAVGVALSIANGVDPTKAAGILELGVKAVKETISKRDAAIDEALKKAAAIKPEDPSTGNPSSANGSGPAEASTSSGD